MGYNGGRVVVVVVVVGKWQRSSKCSSMLLSWSLEADEVIGRGPAGGN
jgi:hypothetical protein